MTYQEDRLVSQLDKKRKQEEQAARRAKAEAPIADEKTLRRAMELARERDTASLSIDHPFFANISEQQKREHRKYVAKMNELFAKTITSGEMELRTLSKAFEFVISERINRSGWLGEMHAQLTTERDDFYNGIDMYVERDSMPIGLSFDITYTKNKGTLKEKLLDIKSRLLDQGNLAQLEYYLPLDKEKREEFETSDGHPLALPKVIIGVTREEMITAVNRYYENRDSKPDATNGLIMLFQVRYQLRHFLQYCQKEAKRYPRIEKTIPYYQRTLEEIEKVWTEKVTSLKLTEDVATNFVTKDPFTKNLIELLDETLPINGT